MKPEGTFSLEFSLSKQIVEQNDTNCYWHLIESEVSLSSHFLSRK